MEYVLRYIGSQVSIMAAAYIIMRLWGVIK